MANAPPNGKLRQYLLELKPQARALLAQELERAALRGEAPPEASTILEQLHGAAREQGHTLPRIGDPRRHFFAVAEPFLVDDTQRKYRGRLARASLGPLWDWICRDLMPAEATAFADQVRGLLAKDAKAEAEQATRTFQDLVERRLRACLIECDADEKTNRRVAGQIGTQHGLDEVRELATILRLRDPLGVIASRLPTVIGNLGDDQLAAIGQLLDSVGRDRTVFLHALLMVRDRLNAPWQLIRVAIHAANSDVAARIAETPFADAIDIVLGDIECMIAKLRDALRAGRSEVADLIKTIHDAARALRTEMDLAVDSFWGRQLAAARAEAARLLHGEIDALPAQVRRLLRARDPRDSHGVLDAGDVEAVAAKLALAAACRNYASELAISEATRRIHSDLQTYFDSGTQVLLDRLRTAPPAERAFRQSQVDAAIRFCGKLFGAEYAGLLAKAADIAAKGEQKAARA